MSDDVKQLVMWVQEAADYLPTGRRIMVLRAMTELLGQNEALARAFMDQARVLVEAERRCAELNLFAQIPKPKA